MELPNDASAVITAMETRLQPADERIRLVVLNMSCDSLVFETGLTRVTGLPRVEPIAGTTAGPRCNLLRYIVAYIAPQRNPRGRHPCDY